jgi:tRNA-dihydrouridine synthase 1
MPPDSGETLLAYTPMLHARLFGQASNYRHNHFQATRTALPSPPDSPNLDLYLDGNPANDRPLFVQFCANSPDELLSAAKHVQPFCDAVDLNLGCPQGIAKKGHYGAFLQEDWGLIYRLINRLHNDLTIPVTAKIRVLETKEQTLEYAKMVLSAGASILTVHGRTREQKGHNTGLADWTKIRYLRDNLPPGTVIFANGNILGGEDINRCLEATGADGVMSAEGNLCDPTIFASPPPVGREGREYWRGRDGKGGFRMDAVMRRYMDILYKYVLEAPPPVRKPLFLPSDIMETTSVISEQTGDDLLDQRPSKKVKFDQGMTKTTSPNLVAMKPHLFSLLRPLVSKHTHIRDALAKCRAGDLAAYEDVLTMVEDATKDGLLKYETKTSEAAVPLMDMESKAHEGNPDAPITALVAKPWWVCQPYVRPLPKEAFQKGSLTLSKKEKARLQRMHEIQSIGSAVDDSPATSLVSGRG